MISNDTTTRDQMLMNIIEALRGVIFWHYLTELLWWLAIGFMIFGIIYVITKDNIFWDKVIVKIRDHMERIILFISILLLFLCFILKFYSMEHYMYFDIEDVNSTLLELIHFY